MLKFHNTRTGQLEAFEPLDPPRVRMYCCGPTVHDFAHIGNFRTFVFEDILNRYLRYLGYDVQFVMNITDIDDKTIRKSQEAGVSLGEYTERYTQAFFEDLTALRVRPADVVCRATEHIPEMIDLVSTLLERGHAYPADGSVYFKVDSFPPYGGLSRRDFAGMRAGVRVDSDEYEKENVRDFVLWKGRREGEPWWDTPFGPGRPGWHLECSAMSMKYGGQTLDLHCGGSDLIFPHHENEIAQSEAATGRPFVRYWLHSEHLIVDNQKMSKSLGNFYTLRDLVELGHRPLAVRYLLLSVHYRQPLNFTLEGLKQAQAALDRLHDSVAALNRRVLPPGGSPEVAAACRDAQSRFESALDDDLNVSAALAALFDFIRDVNRRQGEGAFGEEDRVEVRRTLAAMDDVLGVLTPDPDESVPPDEAVLDLIEQREAARRRREWRVADQLRDQLRTMGVELRDTPEGVVWKRA